MKNLLLIAIAILGFSAASFGQNGNTVTDATASAKIIIPISLAKGADMRFGSMAPSGAIGTVVLSTAGVRTPTNVQLQVAGGATFGAGVFTVTGQPTSLYTVSLPLTINISNGNVANDMTISSLLAKTTSGVEAHSAIGTIEAGGTETFTVGGTLTVAASQATGDYTGTYSVTVNYN